MKGYADMPLSHLQVNERDAAGVEGFGGVRDELAAAGTSPHAAGHGPAYSHPPLEDTADPGVGRTLQQDPGSTSAASSSGSSSGGGSGGLWQEWSSGNAGSSPGTTSASTLGPLPGSTPDSGSPSGTTNAAAGPGSTSSETESAGSGDAGGLGTTRAGLAQGGVGGGARAPRPLFGGIPSPFTFDGVGFGFGGLSVPTAGQVDDLIVRAFFNR